MCNKADNSCRQEKLGCEGCYHDKLKFVDIVLELNDIIISNYKVTSINWELQLGFLKAEIHFKDIKILLELDYNSIYFMFSNKYLDYNSYIKHMIFTRIDNKIIENYKIGTKT